MTDSTTSGADSQLTDFANLEGWSFFARWTGGAKLPPVPEQPPLRFAGLRCPSCKQMIAAVELETRDLRILLCRACGHQWAAERHATLNTDLASLSPAVKLTTTSDTVPPGRPARPIRRRSLEVRNAAGGTVLWPRSRFRTP